MTYILNTYIYTWPFFIGSFITLVVWQIYCRQKAHYLDVHEPLPGGAKHKIEQLNRLWIAGVVLGFTLGYILLSANKAEEHTIALSTDVKRCWAEQYKAAKSQIDINTENDIISRQHQQLQREYDQATSNWLKDLIAPPGDLIQQDTNSPARQKYGLQRTAVYQGILNDLGSQFDNLVAQRKVLDDKRNQHPLPEPTCGK